MASCTALGLQGPAGPQVLRLQSLSVATIHRSVRRIGTRAQVSMPVIRAEDSSQFESVVAEVELLAVKLARQAGSLIREKSGRPLQVDRKGVRYDLVTEVDKACERLMQSSVQDTFPDHCWIGEETATEDDIRTLTIDGSPNRWTWIADPIDGTLSFVDGVPLSVVSIGVAYNKTVEVGVIYNPFYDELFYAKRGGGAFLNGERIKVVPANTELEDTTVTFGIPSKTDKRAAMLKHVVDVGLHCRSLKALGSAALHLRYVAAGRFGGFFENDLKPWDVAAGLLLVKITSVLLLRPLRIVLASDLLYDVKSLL